MCEVSVKSSARVISGWYWVAKQARIAQVARRLQDDDKRLATLFQADVMIRVFTIKAEITMTLQSLITPCNCGNSYYSNNFDAVSVMGERRLWLLFPLTPRPPQRFAMSQIHASIPSQPRAKQLRACLLCSIVQTPADFRKHGCPNCEELMQVPSRPHE